jgi:hypothetical protein
MKAYGVVDVYFHVFLSRHWVVNGQLHVPAASPPSKESPVPIG